MMIFEEGSAAEANRGESESKVGRKREEVRKKKRGAEPVKRRQAPSRKGMNSETMWGGWGQS